MKKTLITILSALSLANPVLAEKSKDAKPEPYEMHETLFLYDTERNITVYPEFATPILFEKAKKGNEWNC